MSDIKTDSLWLMQFSDFSKLKLLNDVITNRSIWWDVLKSNIQEYFV